MGPRLELDQRLATLRAQARGGATPATFRDYESLWRDARREGAVEVATHALRDLAKLTAELDPATAAALARAAATQSGAGTPASGAATSPSAAPRASVPDLSVLVLGFPERAHASPLLDSLDRQTLPRGRFETILSPRTGGAAVNEAAAAATGRILLFATPALVLAPDTLARHVAAHAGTSPRFVLGGLDREGLALRPLAWTLERIGLLGGQHAALEGGAIPTDSVTFENSSLPAATFRELGGCDDRLGPFAAIELGARLAARGVSCVLEPELRATCVPALDLDGWLASVRAMGADRLELRRKHGTSAPPAWLREIGLEEAAVETLFATVLASGDVHARRIDALRESLAGIEQVVARDATRADATLAKLGDDLSALVVQAMRTELARGFVHAAQGGVRDALERCATRTVRGAAVLVASSGAAVPAVSAALTELPAFAEVVVAVPSAAVAQTLPRDRRVVPFALPSGGGTAAMRKALLAATGADFFVLLDGTCVPTRAEWEAVRLALATLPGIGACGVSDGSAALASARPCTSLPAALIAARRDVIEQEGDEAVPFLERLVRRGFRLATATPASSAAPTPSPAASTTPSSTPATTSSSNEVESCRA